jgi:Protein HRI1
MLENGDILEKGEMMDFDDGKVKPYEEIWRDSNAERGDVVWAAEVLPSQGYKGGAIRIGGLCQAILKGHDGVTSSGRWALSSDKGAWTLEFSSGPYGWGLNWPSFIPDTESERVEVGKLEWAVVEFIVPS